MAEQLIYVRYRDHVLFRNTDHTLYEPALRETIGWLYKETAAAVWLLWERSVAPLPHERMQPQQSGMVLLKGDILEIRRLPLRTPANWPLSTGAALTTDRRVGAPQREAKNSARKKSEEGKNHGNIAKRQR